MTFHIQPGFWSQVSWTPDQHYPFHYTGSHNKNGSGYTFPPYSTQEKVLLQHLDKSINHWMLGFIKIRDLNAYFIDHVFYCNGPQERQGTTEDNEAPPKSHRGSRNLSSMAASQSTKHKNLSFCILKWKLEFRVLNSESNAEFCICMVPEQKAQQ